MIGRPRGPAGAAIDLPYIAEADAPCFQAVEESPNPGGDGVSGLFVSVGRRSEPAANIAPRRPQRPFAAREFRVAGEVQMPDDRGCDRGRANDLDLGLDLSEVDARLGERRLLLDLLRLGVVEQNLGRGRVGRRREA